MKIYEVATATVIFIAMSLYWIFGDLTSEPICTIETHKGDQVIVETYPQSVCDEMQGREK